jgi:hypothetical protein
VLLAEVARRLASLELFTEAARCAAGPFVPTGGPRQTGGSLLLEALQWSERTGGLPTVALYESIARAMVAERSAQGDATLEHIRPVLQAAAENDARPRDQSLACLGLRAIAWRENTSSLVREELSLRAADAAWRASDKPLALSAEHALVGDLLASGNERALVALDRYTATSAAVGSALHQWLGARIRLTWALSQGRDDIAAVARHEAGNLEIALDDTTIADADVGTIVAEQLRRNRLETLAGQRPRHDIDAEFSPVVSLAISSIAAASGVETDPSAIADALASATGTPFAVPAAAFASLALRGAERGQSSASTAQRVIDVLAPHEGGLVLVDSGLWCLGPTDAYLAIAHGVIEDDRTSAYYHGRATQLTRRVAPGWKHWVEALT